MLTNGANWGLVESRTIRGITVRAIFRPRKNFKITTFSQERSFALQILYA